MRDPRRDVGPRAGGRRAARRTVVLAAAVFLVAWLGACARQEVTGATDTLRPNALLPQQNTSQVAAGDDDAEEYPDGRVNRSSTRLELVDGTYNQVVGLRFAGVLVPQGVTVTGAYVQFTSTKSQAGATSLSIVGQASDDAASFTSHSTDITSRPRTAASVPWTPDAWASGDAGAAQQTPDLAPILGEIVDRPGWQAGNAVVLMVSGNGVRTAWSYDGNPPAAATLVIDYLLEDSPPSVDAFDATPNPVNLGSSTTFQWAVSDPQGQALSCDLDVDGDGVVDFHYDDCTATTSQSYRYPAGGSYHALFTVTDSDNAVDRSDIWVTVNESLVVAAAGDIACRTTSSKWNGGLGNKKYCHELYTSDEVLDMQPDAVFVLGDNQYEDGSFEQYMASYDPSWGRVKELTFPSVGNHEYLTADAAGYFQYFGDVAGDPSKGYYSFDLGNWHFVVLNSNCSRAGGCSAGRPQEKWLREDLAAHPTACTLAYWHHPLYSSGKIGGRTWTQDIWQALQDYGADVVLNGHDHNYERFAPQDAYGNYDPTGLREFVVGTGGKNYTTLGTPQPNSEVFESGTYGVLRLDLQPTSYSWEFVPEAGRTFTDSGSQACN